MCDFFTKNWFYGLFRCEHIFCLSIEILRHREENMFKNLNLTSNLFPLSFSTLKSV